MLLGGRLLVKGFVGGFLAVAFLWGLLGGCFLVGSFGAEILLRDIFRWGKFDKFQKIPTFVIPTRSEQLIITLKILK